MELLRRYENSVKASLDKPGDAQLRQTQGQCALDLIENLCQEQSRVREAQKIYNQLAALAIAHPKEPGLRLYQANAADHLVQRMAGSATFTSLKIYREIAAHAANYPQEKGLINVQASLLYNLVAYLIEQNMEMAEEHYQYAEKLAQRNMDQPGVRRAWIWAGALLLVRYLESENSESFDALLNPLKETMVDAYLSMRVRVFHLLDQQDKVHEFLVDIEQKYGSEATEIVKWYGGV